jgi:hypothetical protein
VIADCRASSTFDARALRVARAKTTTLRTISAIRFALTIDSVVGGGLVSGCSQVGDLGAGIEDCDHLWCIARMELSRRRA